MAKKKGGAGKGHRAGPAVAGGEVLFTFGPLADQVQAHIAFLGNCKETAEVTSALDALNAVASHFGKDCACPQEQFIAIKPRP